MPLLSQHFKGEGLEGTRGPLFGPRPFEGTSGEHFAEQGELPLAARVQ